MRFVLAIISFVVAAVMLVAGIAQRTFLLEPDEVALSSSSSTDSAVTVIDGDALNAYDGSQSLTIKGSGDIVAAYGRTTDVLAWIGDTEYTEIGFDADKQELTSTLVPGAEKTVPTIKGSDLWLDEYARADSLSLTVKAPSDVSFIVMSDGEKPAPANIAISWPLDNSTPWAGPLIIGGAVALLLGLAFLLWATSHMRSSRGPRRKPQKMPKVPRKRLYKPRALAGRRSAAGMIAILFVLVGALTLVGCTSPGSGTAATPSPSGSAVAAEAQVDPPAATVRQVQRIVADISAVAAKADAAKDATLLGTRFEGPALELRLANYAITTADPTIAALGAIPAGPVKVTLPQQTDTWPRTVFAVIQDDKDSTIPPLALFLEQEDARSNYKVSYAITLEPSAVLPKVAPASIGTSRIADDSAVLRITPEELALRYADILEKDVDSDAYLDFEADGDSLRTNVGVTYKATVRASLPTTATVTFGHALGAADAIAFATNDAGALIAVNLNETTAVTPVEAGAAVNPTGQVKALSGLAISTKGVIATYGDQLLFYVPPAGTDAKIVLLGYTQGLVKAGKSDDQRTTQRRQSEGAVDLSSLVRPPAPAPGAAAAASSGGVVREANDQTFTQILDLSSTVPVIVEFYGQGVEPTLGGLVSQYGGRIALATVDGTANPQLVQAFQVQQVSTVAAVVGGRPIQLFVGMLPEAELRDVLEQVLQLAAQNNVTGSIPVEGAAADAEPVEEPLPPHHQEAYDAIAEGDFATAIKEYETAIAQNPRDQLAVAGLAQVRLLARLDGADAAAVRSAGAESTDLESQLAVADLDVAGGHLDDAFGRLLDLFPTLDQAGKNTVRTRLLDYFEIAGAEDTRVIAARRRLTGLLY